MATMARLLVTGIGADAAECVVNAASVDEDRVAAGRKNALDTLRIVQKP
jgi:hypothetical protein